VNYFPSIWPPYIPFFAPHHEDDRQPQNDSPPGVLRIYSQHVAHERVLGTPSCLGSGKDVRGREVLAGSSSLSEIPHGAMFMWIPAWKCHDFSTTRSIADAASSTHATLLCQYSCDILYRDLWRRQRSATFYQSKRMTIIIPGSCWPHLNTMRAWICLSVLCPNLPWFLIDSQTGLRFGWPYSDVGVLVQHSWVVSIGTGSAVELDGCRSYRCLRLDDFNGSKTVSFTSHQDKLMRYVFLIRPAIDDSIQQL